MKSFRTFRLDTVNHCLWRGEKRVSLAPKAFDVLRFLVEHAERLVTQEEMLEALWPDTYVNPEIIKKYVLEIRKVLGDQSSKPVFVATFPRRGYQFIAPVHEEMASTTSGAATSATKKIVGRESALTRLENALSKTLLGQRQVVFVTGEAGIGKTTLIDAFQQAAGRRANLRVVRGQCVEGFGGKEAYYPVLEALSQWVREDGGGPVVHALAKQAPTWLIQFPSLIKAEQREALQKEILGATRERMVREICEALETLTAQDPLVLVLEDLHWVDPSTLDFISALARRRGPAKLLLLGTYRPADVIISQSPLKALKQDLVIHNLSHEVSLEHLEEVDVGKYICGEFVDGDFPAGFASLIYRRSGGNALFMVTILQDIVKKGLIAQVEGKWTLTAPIETVAQSVPETLDQLIDAQFQQLSAVEQRVLRSASVAGERFSAWAVSTAAEIDPGEIEDVCEGLVAKLQFIKRSGIKEQANREISAHYDFRHSLYREVLYGRLSERARSKLHLLLAQRLKSLCDPCEQELATELALHFEGGRDYEQAIRYLILASENAAGRFAYQDSLEILRHALGLAVKLSPALRDELEIQVLESIGDAHFALGALVQSAQTYTTAAERARQAGLKTAQLHALTLAMYPMGFIDPDQGIATVEEALKVSTSVNDPARLAGTQILAAGCRLVFDAWSQTDANLFTSSCETLLRHSGLDAYQRIVYAHILVLKGNYHEALKSCESSVSPMGHGMSLMAYYGALSAKTSALLLMGQLGKALQVTQEGRASPDENLARYWLLSFREAWLRTVAFDFQGARRICQGTGKVGGEYPDSQGETIDQMAAGYIALYGGKYDRAIEHYRNVLEPAVPTKFFRHWWWRLMARLESSNTWLISGDLLRAGNAADSFLESALSTADPHLQTLAWDLTTRVAMAKNDSKGARESIQQALAIVDKFEILVAAWQVYATAWRVFQHLKEHKRAETNRERAETCILKIANSFEPDEPLRATFLAAAPVRRILRETPVNKPTR
jgi:DNA-binding winged helix-turn-helix (wHTH) protein/tetratricopeptide (TPR) repeat protein